jgi:hypothetical protein
MKKRSRQYGQPIYGAKHTDSNDNDTLKESLGCALDGLLTALVAVGGLPDDPPPESFDDALRADAAHEAAKQAFVKAWKRVSVLVPGDPAKREMLRLEEAASDLAIAASAVAWRLGVAAGRKARSK